jgi:tRNA threonylcarbamoyladenosine biosynthesis protein TsaE
MQLETRNVQQTLALGRLIGSIAAGLPGVTCIGLDGPLGAGKTHLTRGIAEGAGVADASLVSSPTYVLMNIYEGKTPVRHFDAYRVGAAAEFSEIGFEEAVAGTGEIGEALVVVEWGGRVAEVMPADTLWIEIEHEGDLEDQRRNFTLRAGGPMAQRLLERIASDMGKHAKA